jgi:hypothetical protein
MFSLFLFDFVWIFSLDHFTGSFHWIRLLLHDSGVPLFLVAHATVA